MLLTSSQAPYCVRGAHTCRGRRRGVALGASLLRRRVHASRALVTLAVASPPAPQQGDAAGAGAQARSAAVAPGAPIPGSWASATTSQERKRLLLAAIKPPIYSVAMVPVLVRARALSARHATPLHGSNTPHCWPQVGFAVAFFDTGAFVPGVLAAYITCACLIIAWLNLSNDAWVRSPVFPCTTLAAVF